MIKNKTQNDCSGCGACVNVCPVNAILMTQDESGFNIPVVNLSSCIDCGKCNTVCMYEVVDKSGLYQSPLKAFIAWNNSIVLRKQSTSGGLFSVIAHYIISKGGVVYGCAWTKDLSVHHVRVVNEDGLNAFKKSKYIESNTERTFSDVKKDLSSGLKVLYSGTPCQIAGLKLYLGKDYENLITIDLVCEGVPSQLIFHEYIKSIEAKEKSKVIKYTFRDYSEKMHSACITYELDNSKKVSERLGISFFSRLFYSLKINRLSCYKCLYSTSERTGDFTLSDFWGIEDTYPELRNERKYGISMVLCNTEKSVDLFNKLKQDIWYKQVSIERAIESDIRLRGAINKPIARDVIYDELLNYVFNYIDKKYCRTIKSLIYRFVPDSLINCAKKIAGK